MAASHKRRRELEALAASFDRHLVKTRRGHYRLVCNRGERPFVVTSCSPSDPRTMANLEATLKQNDQPKEIRP